jgi:ribosomal protein L40E
MAKFPEAEARLIKGKYVCRNCKSVIKAPPMKVINKEITCRRCKSRALRPKRKK